MKIIGEYWENGYIIKNVETEEEIYRTCIEEHRTDKAGIESLKIWCEQTGREIADSLGAEFIGIRERNFDGII